jgi:hypothetical protein
LGREESLDLQLLPVVSENRRNRMKAAS